MTSKLKEIRVSQNLSQEELAQKSGVSCVTISLIETGRATVAKTDAGQPMGLPCCVLRAHDCLAPVIDWHGWYTALSGGDTVRFWEELLLVLGLSMDGFCAAVCMGMALGEERKAAARWGIAGLVSGCHVVTVVLGCLLGAELRRWTVGVYPWVAAGILTVMGFGMLRSAGKENGCAPGLSPGQMAAMAACTSLDAFTVGVAFSVLGASALRVGALTGAVMGSLALGGVWLGGAVSRRYRKAARLAGGLLLCMMGMRMLAG